LKLLPVESFERNFTFIFFDLSLIVYLLQGTSVDVYFHFLLDELDSLFQSQFSMSAESVLTTDLVFKTFMVILYTIDLSNFFFVQDHFSFSFEGIVESFKLVLKVNYLRIFRDWVISEGLILFALDRLRLLTLLRIKFLLHLVKPDSESR
jgi:hypothetical protein